MLDAIFGFFFFQAEDGIRYLVRSRGLGDVYKRQLLIDYLMEIFPSVFLRESKVLVEPGPSYIIGTISVSYTHLTLPTSDLV